MPPIEQMFDQADADGDGMLTREEIRAFHENMGSGAGRRRQGL
ncbi:MAG: EF-hand domain-containing protein [Lentisphaeria bacterium]|nr:EF-hand domain-containing protein [Lentisphaeria bacterium]